MEQVKQGDNMNKELNGMKKDLEEAKKLKAQDMGCVNRSTMQTLRQPDFQQDLDKKQSLRLDGKSLIKERE